jgi:hypothetical protein
MDDPKSLFLDTTIQIDRIMGEDYTKNEINKKLDKCNIETCTLVLREFKERVVHKCIALLEIIQDCSKWADLSAMIRRHFRNQMAIMLMILEQVDRETESLTKFDKELIIETLEAYIEGGMEKRFHIGIKRIFNETKCVIAREQFRLEQKDHYRLNVKCDPKEVKCNLPDFIAGHSSEMDAIKKRSKTASTSDERAELSAIAEVYCDAVKQSDFNIAKGRNCNILSDAVIALEASEGSGIYTTDSDYEYICPVIGKHFIRLKFLTKSSTIVHIRG